MNIKKDGHVHTQFCPHGSTDIMEEYVLQALQLGLEEISFTEHAPLPLSFNDPAPTKDSSMRLKDVPFYLDSGQKLKEKYKKDLRINIGFEVDYIHEYRSETKAFLDKWGEAIDESILSVHMIPVGPEYICMDYSPDEFGRLVQLLGSVESVHQLYYQIIEQSIITDLGRHKPKRIGHPTLVNKFQKVFPVTQDFRAEQLYLLDLMKKHDLELDANTAGWFKLDCKESYPPLDLIELAKERKIKIIPGSDSHKANHLMRGFEKLES